MPEYPAPMRLRPTRPSSPYAKLCREHEAFAYVSDHNDAQREL